MRKITKLSLMFLLLMVGTVMSWASGTVTFSAGDETFVGKCPDALTGDEVAIPLNRLMYKEGYTLTGWKQSGSSETLAPGASFKPTSDVTLTPVFTANTVNLSDRNDVVTVKWDFQRKNGAPTIGAEGAGSASANFTYVAQAVVNGVTIDVPMAVDVTNGKFANANWTDWCQLNGGTKLTIPSCKGATVSLESYSATTTTTIDGVALSDNTSKTCTAEVASKSETVDVVIGDGSYWRYCQVVLPVVQSAGGKTYTNEATTVEWSMADPVNYSAYTVAPEGVFSTVGVDLGNVRLMDQNGNENATGTSSVSPGVTFSDMRPTNDGNDFVSWNLKPAAGLTFTPTKVSAYIVRFGTDAENGVTISAKAGEGDAVTLGNFTAPRNNKSQADDKYGSSANYAVNGFVEIELNADQQKALTTGDMLSFMGTIGVGNAKAGGIAKVTVTGIINGTTADVAKYTLSAVAAPAEGGSVSTYPISDEYEEGTEVTLTATENFGYDFVNWTDGEGKEVSAEAKFKYAVNANSALTANFKKVNTYELALTVDGTNDYMVTVNPAPTVVDGKNMYEEGSAVELTANQYEGLVTFNNWSDGETSSSKIVSMTGDVKLTAVYSQADIIAGWDFYKAGNSGRVADFYAQDNDADAFNLVSEVDGSTSGWLDKSTVAGGGYESFKGAAVNWRTGSGNGDVGHYYWQTKVNAEAFTNINVQFQMLYNYNAYQTYNAEYSLNGTDWTKFGSITMTGAKSPSSFSETLPAAANNQKELYIRMLADKTSNVDGSASANDGNTIAMVFITGTPKIVDDGVAPVLVSSVPVTGADNASASGKIVLTFDERVAIADGAKASLNAMSLEPAVSGKTVTFSYKGLEYATDYTFTMPANTVSDLTGNFITKAITISFKTMSKPAVTKGMYDAVVSTVDELVAAISNANKRADKNTRYRIFVKKGTYQLPSGAMKHYTHKNSNDGTIYFDGDRPDPITYINGSNISFIGEDREATVITNTITSDDDFAGQFGTTSVYDGIGQSDVLQIASSVSGLYFQDITVSTGMADARGRDIAVQDKGTKNIYKNVKLHGYQDTWTSNNDNGLYYFEGSVLRGRTDFLCGKGDIFFNECELVMCEKGGYLAVPSKAVKYGYVFSDCVINGEKNDIDGNYTLGRPWGSGTPTAYYINTKMNVKPSAVGWSEMSGGWPKQFAEYNSVTSTGSTIDLSGRKTIFGDNHTNVPTISAAEALEIGNMSNMYGDWQPTLDTEQAPLPTNVQLAGTTLSWDNSNYVLCWAVCKNGDVVAFTSEPTFTVDDATAKYSVRAANNMGGLSQAVDAGNGTGISEVAAQNADNANGKFVKNGQVVIVKDGKQYTAAGAEMK